MRPWCGLFSGILLVLVAPASLATLAINEGTRCGTFGAECRPGEVISFVATENPPPPQPGDFCPPQRVPTSLKGSETLTWTWGDGSTDVTTTARASHIFNSEGGYDITVVRTGQTPNEATGVRVADAVLRIEDLRVTEGASLAVVTARRDHADHPTAVGYNVRAFTADYLPTEGTLTFAAGEATKTFSVVLLRPDDTTFTGDTRVSIELISLTPALCIPDSTPLGVVIVDDDRPAISMPGVIEVKRYGYADFTIAINGDIQREMFFAFRNLEYVSSPNCVPRYTSYFDWQPGTIYFSPTNRSQTVRLRLQPDRFTAVPAITSFITELSNGPPGYGFTRTSIEVHVIDDDTVPSLSIEDASVFEGNGPPSDMPVTVRLLMPAPVEITASWATSDITARGGRDYVASHGLLRFAPGETVKTIRVPVIGNTGYDGDRTFGITLTTGAPIRNAMATCTILEDDAELAPQALRMSVGTSASLTLRVPRAANGADAIEVTSSNDDRVRVQPVALAPGAKEVDIPLTALRTGATTITVAAPTFGVPIMRATITVYQPMTLTASMEPPSLQQGSFGTVTLSATPPPGMAIPATVLVRDPSIVRAPEGVVISESGVAAFQVQALAPGSTSVIAQLSSFYGNATGGVRVDVREALLPAVESIEPAAGVAPGGTAVIIRGSGFDPSCVVSFGGIEAERPAFTDGKLLAVTPSHVPGVVDVTAVCAKGTGTLPGGFEYILPRPRAVRH